MSRTSENRELTFLSGMGLTSRVLEKLKTVYRRKMCVSVSVCVCECVSVSVSVCVCVSVRMSVCGCECVCV